MSHSILKTGLLAGMTCLALFLNEASFAQQGLPPQTDYYIGEGEVDLHRGVFLYSHKDLSIGGEEGTELALTRFHGVRSAGSEIFGYSTGHNFEVLVYQQAYIMDGHSPGMYSYSFYVVNGRSVEQFDLPYGTSRINPIGFVNGTLTRSSANGPYTYTAKDGTIINFSALAGCQEMGFGTSCAPATSIVRPDGENLSFAYDRLPSTPRLRLVSNNRGFAIGFLYPNTTSRKISQACGVNISQHLASVSAPCPSGARTVSYGYTGSNGFQLGSFTDAAGQTTTYTHDYATSAIATIRGPGSAAADLTNTYDSYTLKLTNQTYGNGQTWGYAYQAQYPWEWAPDNEWTDVKSPLGNVVRHQFPWGVPPKPGSIVDPINRTTQFRYIAGKPELLERKIEPEGNYLKQSYDSRDNLIERRAVAKAGSGLADAVTSWSYPAGCSNLKTCNKPDYMIDPRGNRTDFTYDPVHGNILTETGPAVNGVRPQTRYSYTQRYAWLRNGSGSYSRVTTPLWLLTSKSICKTGNASGAGCALAGDEVITSYDYGPDSGPNNLLLRGVVEDAGSLSLRTCYAYDAQGNKISETEPKAGLTSCP